METRSFRKVLPLVCFPLSQRGAILLLNSYLLIFWLIVLSTAMLVRGSVELEYAKTSVGQHQTFLQSEAGFDSILYGLKVTPPNPPSGLVQGQCTFPASAVTTNGLTYLYQLCRPSSDYYKITTIAPGPRASVVITGFAYDPTQLKIANALVGLDQAGTVSLSYAEVASLDSVHTRIGGSTMPMPTPPPGHVRDNGNIAGLGTDSLTGGLPAISVMDFSTVRGSLFIPPGLPVEAVIIDSKSTVGNEEGIQVQVINNLNQFRLLPTDILIPQNATELNDVAVLNGDTYALPPGVYSVHDLTVGEESPGGGEGAGGGDSEGRSESSPGHSNPAIFKTYGEGPVELYVYGTFSQSPNSKVYGQHGGSSETQNNYDPVNLRIFVLSQEDGQNIRLESGLTVAALYAPTTNVEIIGNQHFYGGIVAKNATITGEASANAAIYYDESLGSQSISVNAQDDRWALLLESARQVVVSGPPSEPNSYTPEILSPCIVGGPNPPCFNWSVY